MAGRSSVPSEQRVFSLVLALVVSPEGLTKRELLSSVYGYADRYVPGEPSAALDRQFERDKDQLRALGIQIDTLDSPLEPGNNQLTRYRIAKDRLEFPPELQFSERELVLLRLAAFAWREGSLSAESRRAAMKLEALGAGLELQHLGVAPSLGTAEPAAAPLQRAIDEGRTVRFAYALPGRESALQRHVAPLRLHRLDGRWHLISWDLERSAERTFLLSRISGPVRVGNERFDPELRERTEHALAELIALRTERRAQLRVRRGGLAESRLASRADAVTPVAEDPARVDLELGLLDWHILADELVGYGAEVSVISPAELRDLVVAGLRAVLADHGGGHRA
ncbi:WYL domain-containing protein [Leucobacter sp. CSA2]|uniref:WYL domain-containing protein n=1 Tax=Leucobacter edaphi TaxID=2796472 RepID=A0A934QDT5_9MICO|nr:WYL domain-containing protein [Leucobacter edaphi]MBK0421407.1 WYL domain-containing protein [Leucobacter edaphi]